MHHFEAATPVDRNIRVLVTRPCIDKLPGQQGRWWQSKAKAAIATDQQSLHHGINFCCSSAVAMAAQNKQTAARHQQRLM